MGRDVPFSHKNICDSCLEEGAFDFMGDYICMACYEKLPDHDGCGLECDENCPGDEGK